MTDKVQKWLIWFALLTSIPVAWTVIVAAVQYWEAVLWLVTNIEIIKDSVETYQYERLPQNFR